MCNISVDVARVPCIVGMSRIGFPSLLHELEIIITFSETEFKAQLSWMEEVRLLRTHPRSTD